MTLNEPLPPNRLRIPVSLNMVHRITQDMREAQRIIRQSCHFIAATDHVTVHSAAVIRQETPVLKVMDFTFSVLTLGGNQVYCSPIDWTSPTPTVAIIDQTDPETAGGQTPHELATAHQKERA